MGYLFFSLIFFTMTYSTKFKWKLFISIALLLVIKSAQSQQLPLFNKTKITIKGDWLVDPINAKAGLYQTGDGQLVFANGLVARSFATNPNGATIALELLSKNESFLRSVRPEAEVEIDNIKFKVGGLTG